MTAFNRETFHAARERIVRHVHRTPLQSATLLGEMVGTRLFFKCENFQKTGSFKPRGVLNLLGQLDDAERRRGVVTISAGNHAQAVAWAARQAGIGATVVMPEGASSAKVAASRGYGAEVVLHGDVFEAFAKAHELERDRRLTFVHPFDDPRTVAGTGTVGLEILEQHPDVNVVVVPVGGGGLIAGIATLVKLVNPGVRVYGVEPTGAAAMRASLDAGHAVRLDKVDTVADGLAPPMAGEINYELVSRHVDDVVTVTDAQLIEAMGLMFSRAKLVVEPSGAAGFAALRAGKIPVQPTDHVVAVASGGNIAPDRLAELLSTPVGG